MLLMVFLWVTGDTLAEHIYQRVLERCTKILHLRVLGVLLRCFRLLRRCFPCLHLGLHTVLANTLVINMATAVLHNFALMHRERDFDEDIEDEVLPFDIVAVADRSGNGKRQLIINFRDYLFNKTSDDLMKWHVRFFDNKIGNKREHLPQYINHLPLFFGNL